MNPVPPTTATVSPDPPPAACARALWRLPRVRPAWAHCGCARGVPDQLPWPLTTALAEKLRAEREERKGAAEGEEEGERGRRANVAGGLPQACVNAAARGCTAGLPGASSDEADIAAGRGEEKGARKGGRGGKWVEAKSRRVPTLPVLHTQCLATGAENLAGAVRRWRGKGPPGYNESQL